MKTLHLNLVKKWYDMTSSGIKREDYREPNDETEFWEKRLLQCYEDLHLKKGECKKASCTSCLNVGGGRFKQYDIVNERNGMKKGDKGINYKFEKIEYREGRKEWGAEHGKKYFVIKLGDIIPIQDPQHSKTRVNKS